MSSAQQRKESERVVSMMNDQSQNTFSDIISSSMEQRDKASERVREREGEEKGEERFKASLSKSTRQHCAVNQVNIPLGWWG